MDTHLPLLAATATVATLAGHRAYDRYSREWGSTNAERAMPMPGDDFLPASSAPTTMAITINAPPEHVWPWLVQMGIDRAGLYTHTWVENGIFHLDVTNADRIEPRWQDVKVGDRILFMRPTLNRPAFGPVVVAFEASRYLVLNNGPTTSPDGTMGTWQFLLQARGTCGTRLLLRSRASTRRPVGMKLLDAVFEPGYQYMDIGMLRGVRERAERMVPPVPSVALG